jgi:hypothetical protein
LGGFSPSQKARKNQLVKSLLDIYYIYSLFSPLFSMFSHEYRRLIQDFFIPLTGLLPDLAKSSLGIIIILAASMVIGLFSKMLRKKKILILILLVRVETRESLGIFPEYSIWNLESSA